MGLWERIMAIFGAKVHDTIEKFEDPEELLNYSFEKQHDLINRLRQDIAQVVTAKKRLEMQKAKITANLATLEQQARRSLQSNREDLARLALERKNVLQLQIGDLDKQISDIGKEQNKLEDAEKRLATQVEQFKTKKEMIKAQYSAAEAQVKIKESVTGISEEMNDIGMVLNRVQEKTENMQAKAQALDELIDTGTLVDYTSTYPESGSDIESELDKVSLNSVVDEELAKMKSELNKTSSG